MAEIASCACLVTLTRAFLRGSLFQQRTGIQAKCLEEEMWEQAVSVVDSGKPAIEPCQPIRRESQGSVKQACSHLSVGKQYFSSKPTPNPNTLWQNLLLILFIPLGSRKAHPQAAGALSSIHPCHPLGKKKGCVQEIEPWIPNVMCILPFETLWMMGLGPVTQRPPSPSSLWFWVTFRITMFVSLPHPSAAPGWNLTLSESPPLISENPPKWCLPCAFKLLCHLLVFELLLQNPLSTSAILMGGHQKHAGVRA